MVKKATKHKITKDETKIGELGGVPVVETEKAPEPERKIATPKKIKTFHLPAKGLTIKATSLAEALTEAEKLQ